MLKTCRTGLATAALLLATPALSQQAEGEVTPAPLPTAIPHDEMTADMLSGAEVFSIEGADIGEVGDIVFTSAGDLDAAVIAVGGFLGFGQHRVSIPVEDLVVIERVDREGEMIVQVPLTKAQMKALPAYEADPVAEDVPVTE